MKLLVSPPATTRVTAAAEQPRMPDQRRPIVSARSAQNNRPTKAETATQIIRNDASFGRIRTIMTSNVVDHSASRTPLVCDSR